MSRTRVVVLLTTGSLAVASVALAATQKITFAGVGHVHIGDKYTKLRSAGRLGKIQPGCELAGPNARSANLVAPVKGSVDLSFHSPRKVTNITITGGATARGVGIGDKT